MAYEIVKQGIQDLHFEKECYPIVDFVRLKYLLKSLRFDSFLCFRLHVFSTRYKHIILRPSLELFLNVYMRTCTRMFF